MPSPLPSQKRLHPSPIALSWLCLLLLSGCARFHHDKTQYVYVSARQAFLRDRVAAVSNRVAEVKNGEALAVVEQGKRFTKVRTAKGQVGWLEDHLIIDDKLYGQFEDLKKTHAADPVVSSGELRDDLNLHILPGRETPHFLVLNGGTKVQLLLRGAIAKPQPPGGPPKAAPSSADSSPAVPTPPPMDDWWLIRDPAGNCGWIIARQLYVDAPEEIGGYAEGQRMIGAYPIAKVMDSGVERVHKSGKPALGHHAGKAMPVEETPDTVAGAQLPTPIEHTEYVAALAPLQGGLPYDFDQIRVFTWSLNHHRYETAFRLHGIRGYLPVHLGTDTVNGQSMPTFSFPIASGPSVSVDPDTGVTRPVAPRTLTFRLEGNLVRRIGPDLAPIDLTHTSDPAKPVKSKAKKKH